MTAMTNPRIPASIELSAKQALDAADLPGLFPPGTRVYVTDLGTDPDAQLIRAARRLTDLGYVAVPHLAARRAGPRKALEARLGALAEQAGVRDMLVIGGGPRQPAGDFASTMEVLETGLFDRFGIADIGIAGHPEGTPDVPPDLATAALHDKAAFARRTDARMRIVTQFGFDGAHFVDWVAGLPGQGIDLPVHLGVAGPARMTTLLTYAMACGVGNSLAFLRKRAKSLAALTANQSPEPVVAPIERQFQAQPDGNLRQIHVFAFGGLAGAASWLHDRGSWRDPGAAADDGARP